MTTELRKEAGESKEAHESRLSATLPLFDVHGYVDDFNRAIVPAYKRGIADAELPADAGVARSIIPPGPPRSATSATLRPRYPSWMPRAASAA